jgi:hypothetical protein
VFSPGVSPQNTPGPTQIQTPEQQPPPSLSSTHTPRPSIDIDADSVAYTGGEVTDHGDKGEITSKESTQDQAPKASFMCKTDFIRIHVEQFDLKVIGAIPKV